MLNGGFFRNKQTVNWRGFGYLDVSGSNAGVHSQLIAWGCKSQIPKGAPSGRAADSKSVKPGWTDPKARAARCQRWREEERAKGKGAAARSCYPQGGEGAASSSHDAPNGSRRRKSQGGSHPGAKGTSRKWKAPDDRDKGSAKLARRR